MSQDFRPKTRVRFSANLLSGVPRIGECPGDGRRDPGLRIPARAGNGAGRQSGCFGARFGQAVMTRERDMPDVAKRRRFLLFLVKCSHYDDQGYVIQWWKSALPSNSLACLFGIAQKCMEDQVLSENVDIEIF